MREGKIGGQGIRDGNLVEKQSGDQVFERGAGREVRVVVKIEERLSEWRNQGSGRWRKRREKKRGDR